jgi:hypothetical protein
MRVTVAADHLYDPDMESQSRGKFLAARLKLFKAAFTA